MRSIPTFGVFFEVLLMISYFFFKAIFFKDDFSGVNFTAWLLATYPKQKEVAVNRVTRVIIILNSKYFCLFANYQESSLQNSCLNRKNFRLEARAQLFEFRLRAPQML